jgi:hypothetical protein
MPPEHAGAAAAFLSLRLADEYHGQVVNGYEVLERISQTCDERIMAINALIAVLRSL